MRKLFNKLGDILLRFYTEIIAGVWAVLLVIPLDCFLYDFFTGVPSYPLDLHYWIFFGCYTTFFILSGSFVPIIRKQRILTTLQHLENIKQITALQKKKILFTLKDVSSYQSILTMDGFLHFLMENIFSVSVMFAYFGIEGLIANIINDRTLVVPIIFIILFLALLIIESFLDDHIAQITRKKRKSSDVSKMYGANKTLMMQLLEDVGGGGSSSEKIGQIILEETIEDIAEIINISTEKTEAKKKRIRKFGKSGLPKGRLEKAKKGAIYTQNKKKVSGNNNKKRKNKRKTRS